VSRSVNAPETLTVLIAGVIGQRGGGTRTLIWPLLIVPALTAEPTSA
jgi:hypothetical protein